MGLTFPLFVQKHATRMDTVIPLPSFDLAVGGRTLDPIARGWTEALVPWGIDTPIRSLHRLEDELILICLENEAANVTWGGASRASSPLI